MVAFYNFKKLKLIIYFGRLKLVVIFYYTLLTRLVKTIRTMENKRSPRIIGNRMSSNRWIKLFFLTAYKKI